MAGAEVDSPVARWDTCPAAIGPSAASDYENENENKKYLTGISAALNMLH